MDVTSVPLGTSTRDTLAEYRDLREFDNYNEAVKSLLAESGADLDLEVTA